jgi:hypothetical protein
VRAALERDGYVVEEKFCSDLPTLEVAQSLGRIVNIPDLLPCGRIPTVQSIRPREKSQVGDNQYSGHYGLNAFPLHTDLAHWILPPRYFLLRCLWIRSPLSALDSTAVVAFVYREKYPVFERTLSPSRLGRMTILRKESSLMGLLG